MVIACLCVLSMCLCAETFQETAGGQHGEEPKDLEQNTLPKHLEQNTASSLDQHGF